MRKFHWWCFDCNNLHSEPQSKAYLEALMLGIEDNHDWLRDDNGNWERSRNVQFIDNMAHGAADTACGAADTVHGVVIYHQNKVRLGKLV